MGGRVGPRRRGGDTARCGVPPEQAAGPACRLQVTGAASAPSVTAGYPAVAAGYPAVTAGYPAVAVGRRPSRCLNVRPRTREPSAGNICLTVLRVRARFLKAQGPAPRVRARGPGSNPEETGRALLEGLRSH